MVGDLARRAAPPVAVAAVCVLAVELARAASPLLDLAAGERGVVGAAWLALLVFAAPALAGPLVAATGAARATAAAVAATVLLRLVAQAQDPATLPVVGAAAAVGVAALVLVVRQVAAARSAVAATTGLLLGGIADLAVRTLTGSWDPVFQPGALPWLPPVVAGALALAALPLLLAAPDRPVPRVGALGPYLALYVMGYGSAPILAAHAGIPLPAAGAVLVATALAALELVRRLRLPGGTGEVPEPARWYAGGVALVGLVAGMAVGYLGRGPLALAGLVVAGLAAPVLLARALTPGPEPRARTSRPAPRPARSPVVAVGGAALLAGLGYVLPVLLYQAHYDLEFPFDNRLALVAAAAALGLAGAGVRQGAARTPAGAGWRRAWPAPATAVAALALLAPLAVAVTAPAGTGRAAPGSELLLMSWNVKYGRHHTRGEVDPASIAAAVEAVEPDVLVLQEVSRGWPIGGGTDLAEWLSRRLGMRYRWSPAADGQFGNLLLTRLPLSEVEVARLPFVQGPMERSYLAATVPLAGGQRLRIIVAHLQHRTENTATRLAQSEAMLAVWGGAPHTVVAGDFNFWPTWPAAELWAEAGFVSAQDATGHGEVFTVPSDDPDNRVDWIFGTPDLAFSDFAVGTAYRNSDHFPLIVTVTPR